MLLKALRDILPPLLRQNGLATKNSLCSLRLPPFLLSPLAHNAPQKAIAFSGTPLKLVGAPIGTRALNLNCNDSDSTLKCGPLHSIRFSGIVSDAPDTRSGGN